MELKIYIKQSKNYDKDGNEVYYFRKNAVLIEQTIGTLPAHRQFDSYNKYIDITDSASDLYKLSLTWSIAQGDDGVQTFNDTFTKKASSGSITFEGEAYQLLKRWLIDDETASLNAVDILIEHVGCVKYVDWSIKSTDLRWCEDDICTFDVNLKQKDESLSCIRRTLITDNWQEWFPDNGKPPSKRHPRFSYCNEIRPNGLLIAVWWMMAQLSSLIIMLAITIGPIINVIIAVIKAVIWVINAIITIINTLGGNITPLNDNIDFITAKDIKDIIGNFFVESAGCGREHPAPLIRDYISNVCSRCNVTVNEVTAPLFFSRTMDIETSIDRDAGTGAQSRTNYYYNACYFYAPSARGIRRFDTLNVFSGANKNTTDWWIPRNAPQFTLDMFLDHLKPLFNYEWRIENNTLYIQRKDYYIEDTFVYDFSENGADRSKLVTGICYEWNDKRVPAYIDGIYNEDAADVCGNEANTQMNSVTTIGNININPNLEGVLNKKQQFGGTKFRLDGASTDYIYDALQNVANTQFIGAAPWLPPMLENINDNYLSIYADYALLLKQESATLPKILIWDEAYFDGEYPYNAKAVKLKNAWPGTGNPMPTPNTRYNNYPTVQPWNVKHNPQTFTSGSSLSLGTYPPGYYTVRAVFGGLIAQNAAQLVNYPMYFESAYGDNLYDWFHWIDDPLLNPTFNMNFTAKIRLCCDDLKYLGVGDDAQNIRIGQKVKLPLPNNPDGVIREITVSYDTEDTYGQYIEIKGVV